MKYYIGFLVLGIILLAFFLKEKLRAYSVKAVLFKTAASVTFLAAALIVSYSLPADTLHQSFSAYILGGLFFGLLGDIWLDLKYVYRKDDKIYTYAGFAVFAIGHLLYISGMLTAYAGAASLAFIAVPLLIGLLMGIVNGMLGRLMELEFGKFKPVVMAYGAILFMMTLLAGSLAFNEHFQNMTLNLMFIGGILFAISDLILSGTYFGQGKERPIDLISNYIFYFAAQFTIAACLLFVK